MAHKEIFSKSSSITKSSYPCILITFTKMHQISAHFPEGAVRLKSFLLLHKKKYVFICKKMYIYIQKNYIFLFKAKYLYGQFLFFMVDTHYVL